MQRHSSNVQDTFGNAVGGVTVTVRLAGTGTLATIYSDNGSTVKANPFTNDSDGEFFFYASNGRYDIVLSGPVSETRADQILFDPDNAGLISETIIVTADFTAEPGVHYFIDVTSEQIDVTLPASPKIQDAGIVFTHYKGNIATNKIVLGRNGNNIMGLAENMDITTDNASVQLAYSDASQGWRIAVTNV